VSGEKGGAAAAITNEALPSIIMGIQDRDYMKRRPSDDDDRRGGSSGSSTGANAEEMVSRFLERHPKFFWYAGIALGALVVIGLAIAKLSAAEN
jgi:hypothetical protein